MLNTETVCNSKEIQLRENTDPKLSNISSSVFRITLYCVTLQQLHLQCLHSAAHTHRQLTCSPRFILSPSDSPEALYCVSWSWQMWEEMRSILTLPQHAFRVYFRSQPTPQPYFPDPDPRIHSRRTQNPSPPTLNPQNAVSSHWSVRCRLGLHRPVHGYSLPTATISYVFLFKQYHFKTQPG
jgi:hypothetical protein